MEPIAVNPGKKFAIIGFVFSFFSVLSIAGLVLSILALLKSKKASFKNGLAVAGIIVSSVNIVFVTPFFFLFVFVGYSGIANTANAHTACSEQANVGMVTVGGDMYDCDPFGRMVMTAN